MAEDFVGYDLAVKLKEKGFKEKCFAYYYPKGSGLIFNQNQFRGGIVEDCLYSNNSLPNECMASDFVDAPTIYQVLKWLRDEKNIDVEIHAVVGILGCKVYIPYISTYTEFALEASPEFVRYRQKKFNTTTPLKHEIIPAHKYFEEWEEAALDAIKYVLDNIIKEE